MAKCPDAEKVEKSFECFIWKYCFAWPYGLFGRDRRGMHVLYLKERALRLRDLLAATSVPFFQDQFW